MKYIKKFDSVADMTAALANSPISVLGMAMDGNTPVVKIVIPPPPSNLVISCSSNTVTISSTNATTLEYNLDGGSNYTTYTEPFAITETVTVYAKATNGGGSITASQVCEYIPIVDYTIPFYIEDISGSTNTVTIKRNNDSSPSFAVQKSTDGTTWINMGTVSTTGITASIPANGKLYLRAKTNNWSKGNSSTGIKLHTYISTSENCNVGGNIMSLLYGSDFTGYETVFPNNAKYIFHCLFYDNTHIISAENLILPATTLANSCYAHMFYGCSSLTIAPVLPATTLSGTCYQSMFRNCTSLTTAPVLPATTLGATCYQNMFRDCTSLTTAPELPATILAQNCYNNMFYGCTSLNYIKCLATNISASDCTKDWVSGVAAEGTFVKDPNMTDWATGNNGIPSDWTVQDASE